MRRLRAASEGRDLRGKPANNIPCQPGAARPRGAKDPNHLLFDRVDGRSRLRQDLQLNVEILLCLAPGKFENFRFDDHRTAAKCCRNWNEKLVLAVCNVVTSLSPRSSSPENKDRTILIVGSDLAMVAEINGHSTQTIMVSWPRVSARFRHSQIWLLSNMMSSIGMMSVTAPASPLQMNYRLKKVAVAARLHKSKLVSTLPHRHWPVSAERNLHV